MDKQAWYCPSCKAHHAPHVETCPASREASDVRHDYGGLRGVSLPARPVHDPCAGCSGNCGNIACPKRTMIWGGPVSTAWGLAP